MAGRPLKGSFNERGEVCDASVPRRRGDRPRVHSSTFRRPRPLEVDEVLEADAAVPVWLLERHGARFEELDEGWPAHSKEVGRLLGSEERPLGGDEGGFALAHDLDDMAQNPVDLVG